MHPVQAPPWGRLEEQWVTSGWLDAPHPPPSQPGLKGRRGPTHPVEHVGPALHSDALVHGQHGEAKVVKVGDAVVGPRPAAPALAAVDGARAA